MTRTRYFKPLSGPYDLTVSRGIHKVQSAVKMITPLKQRSTTDLVEHPPRCAFFFWEGRGDPFHPRPPWWNKYFTKPSRFNIISWSALIPLVDDAFSVKKNCKARRSEFGYDFFTSPNYGGTCIRYCTFVLANFRETVSWFHLFAVGKFSSWFHRFVVTDKSMKQERSSA